jgi:hypothetical protein
MQSNAVEVFVLPTVAPYSSGCAVAASCTTLLGHMIGSSAAAATLDMLGLAHASTHRRRALVHSAHKNTSFKIIMAFKSFNVAVEK